MTAYEETGAQWRKSSFTNVNCVEVRMTAERVEVRDSKYQKGPMLTFTHPEWQAFLKGVRAGEFELPEL